MIIEAIIANRNELPMNLWKTVNGLQEQGLSVRVVDDEPSLGCGWRRHEGIISSSADIVFLCDGHMSFSPGYFEQVAAHLAMDPLDIVVSRMQSLDHDWTPIPGQVYAAAEIQSYTELPGGQFIPIGAKWRRADTGNGPVGCLMGACYGMLRDRYLSMGQPLSVLQAWGMDEEILSIACWMTGGKVSLIDGLASHVFAAPKLDPAPLSDHEVARIWANRLSCLHAVPMPFSLFDGLTDWLRRTEVVRRMYDYIELLSREKSLDIRRLFNTLAGGSMTFESYLDVWCNHQKDSTQEEKERDMRAVKADAVRKTVVKPAKEPKAVKPKRPYVQSPRVVDPGIPCKHCQHRYDHVITNTYPNGNRRRICGGCGQPFITVRSQEPS